jgi:uncharacterized protein (TIGR04255 family)
MPRPRLPNAPLGEVVFEIRFPGDLRLLSKWGEIQSELRSEFPNLLVPRVREGEFPALKPYHVSSEDQSERITLAVNLFGFITQRYLDFEAFSARYAPLFGIFVRHFRPPVVTRAGLRYLNWLPAVFPAVTQGADQVHPCLNLRLGGLPAGLKLAQPLLIARLEAREATIMMQLGSDERGIRLDFDCYREAQIPTEEVLSVLDGEHKLIDDLFFDVVTPEYLSYMRGDQ